MLSFVSYNTTKRLPLKNPKMVNTKCLLKMSFLLQVFLLRVEAGPTFLRGKDSSESTEQAQINRQAEGNDEDEISAFWATVLESSMTFTPSTTPATPVPTSANSIPIRATEYSISTTGFRAWTNTESLLS
jgi:hypothetical protein